MKKISVEVSKYTFESLKTLVKNCNEAHKKNEGFTSHGGELTVSTLLAMLAEDAAMVETRPGSWEGSNMQTVLSSHGYNL